MARLTSSTGLPRPGQLPPREEAPPRPQGAIAGVAMRLCGRPRPLLGGCEPSPSWWAFPFSAAENLFIGAMGVAASSEARKKKQAEWEEMGDGVSAPSPFIAGEGQPTTPTIAGNDGFFCMHQGLVKLGRCRGSVGKRRRPRPISRHTSTATGCWGPRRSALAPWLCLEAKSEGALARGLLSAFWERGSPDLPACGPRRGSSSGLVWPIFTSKHSRPSRGTKPREAHDVRPPRG